MLSPRPSALKQRLPHDLSPYPNHERPSRAAGSFFGHPRSFTADWIASEQTC